MRERLARTWRVVATAAMIGFFATSVAMSVAFFLPWVRLAYRDERARIRRVRRAASRLARRTTWLGERLGAYRLEVEGAERLRGPGRLVVGNHPTMIDALALLPLLDEGFTVTIRRRWDHPVMRQAIHGAGFLFADGPELVDACTQQLEHARIVARPADLRQEPQAVAPVAVLAGVARVILAPAAQLGLDLLEQGRELIERPQDAGALCHLATQPVVVEVAISHVGVDPEVVVGADVRVPLELARVPRCLLYTSDAADE